MLCCALKGRWKVRAVIPLDLLSPIRLISQYHSLTHPHRKSTLSSVCERLIRVENDLPPTCHRLKIRPKNKGIQPFTNRHKPKTPASGCSRAHRHCEPCNLSIPISTHPLIRPISPVRPIPSHLLGGCDAVTGHNPVTAVTFLKPIVGYYSLFTPIPARSPPGARIIFPALGLPRHCIAKARWPPRSGP